MAHIVQGFFDEAADEWEEAQRPSVRFDGAIVYVPVGTAEVLDRDDAFAWVGAVVFGLTPSFDRDGYPGELTVRADALDRAAAYPKLDPPSCDQIVEACHTRGIRCRDGLTDHPTGLSQGTASGQQGQDLSRRGADP